MNDLEHYMTRAGELAREVSALKAELNTRYCKEIGETWYWQGDGYDHLESTTCPILIEASDLRELLEKAKAEAPLPQSIQEALNNGDGVYRP